MARVKLKGIELNGIKEVPFSIDCRSGSFASGIKFGIVLPKKQEALKRVNVFFAGSTELQNERNIYSDCVTRLQHKWLDRGIELLFYNYDTLVFDKAICQKGAQKEYESFIETETDIFVVVLVGKIGGITLEEFNTAVEAYTKEYKKPHIYVYSQKLKDNSDMNFDIKRRVDELKQYWISYKDTNELRGLFENHLKDYLEDVFDKTINKSN